MAEKDIHYYEPANGHGLKYDPCHRRTAADRLDFLARRQGEYQPRTVQLFQRVLL
jgi:hypothetical protein